jgi:hypothetical protein
MTVETIGEAYSLGWRVRMRCAWGPHDAMRRIRECAFRCELDLQTLVCTRGAAMPLSLLPERLKCSRCGSRRASLIYEPPSEWVRATERGEGLDREAFPGEDRGDAFVAFHGSWNWRRPHPRSWRSLVSDKARTGVTRTVAPGIGRRSPALCDLFHKGAVAPQGMAD